MANTELVHFVGLRISTIPTKTRTLFEINVGKVLKCSVGQTNGGPELAVTRAINGEGVDRIANELAAMEDTQVLAVGLVAWTAAFLAVRLLLRTRSWDFCNRCISMFHVFVAVYLCSASVKDWSRPLDGIGGPSSPLQMRAITVSLSYFIYDFFCCLLDVPVDYANAVHHLITIVGLLYGLLHATCGTELVACLWLMELSNPFMHARELFKEFGLKDTSLNLANDLSFVTVFTFARLLVGPYVTYHTMTSQSPYAVKFGALGIQVVSLFWFYKIARMVLYKVRKSRKGSLSKKE